jgi:hypothetical protein
MLLERQMETKTVVALEVVDIGTDKVVHTVDVSDQSDSMIDRVEMGMLMNMDLDRFSVRRKVA